MAVLDALDDIELRARTVQGIGPIDPFVLKPAAPTPGGLSPVSSIGLAAKKENAPRFHPELSPPKGYDVRFDLIAHHIESIRLADRGAALFDAELKVSMDDVMQMQKEKQAALHKQAEAAQSRATWSAAVTVAQYVTGTSLAMLGWTVGGLAGSLMIGAAGIGLANRLAHDTPLMDQFVSWMEKTDEAQKTLSTKIDLFMLSLQTGLGIAGGVMAWQAGAFAAAQAAGGAAAITKSSAIVSTAGSIMGAGSKVGVQYYSKQMADMQARMQEIQGHITTDQQTIYQDSAAMARILEDIQGQTEAIRRALHDLQIPID